MNEPPSHYYWDEWPNTSLWMAGYWGIVFFSSLQWLRSCFHHFYFNNGGCFQGFMHVAHSEPWIIEMNTGAVAVSTCHEIFLISQESIFKCLSTDPATIWSPWWDQFHDFWKREQTRPSLFCLCWLHNCLGYWTVLEENERRYKNSSEENTTVHCSIQS